MNRILLLLLLVLPAGLIAQNDLPHYPTDKEKNLIEQGTYVFPVEKDLFTDPPIGPLRSMSEWEELQALTITWTSFKPTLAEIVRHAKEECEVVIICNDSTSVKNELTFNYDLDNLNNVSFIEEGYNSIWIRDYGANPVYQNDVDSLILIDWIYNRPRPLDDQVPNAVGEHLDIPVYATTDNPYELVHTGGNYMADGLGTSFSSELILDENPGLSEAEIDDIMYQFMGVERYIKMETLPYDVIHHIDMHMRLLDEETLMIGEYPPGTADGPQIEANLQYVLSNFNSAYDMPYRVVRIPMPPDNGQYPNVGWADYRTYTNSVIVNKTILMPAYEPSFDQTAIDIYEENMPGYKVVPIDCNQIIESLGALHCITKEVGVDDPLWIVHQRLRNAVDVTDDFAVEATIKHREGIAAATLYYTTDTTQAYQSVAMTLTDDVEKTWTGYIPNPLEDQEIFYYILAEANNGKTLTRPMTAPAGFWNFTVTFTNVSYENLPEPDTRLANIYPNPASAMTVIPVHSNTNVEARIELLDVLGRNVRTIFDGTLTGGDQQFFLDARELPAGSYIVQMRNGNQIHNQKLIIK